MTSMDEPPPYAKVTIRVDLTDGTALDLEAVQPDSITIDREREIATVTFDDHGVPHLPMERDVYRLTVTTGAQLLKLRRAPDLPT